MVISFAYVSLVTSGSFSFLLGSPKAHHGVSHIIGVQQNAKCNETFPMFSQTHRSNSRLYVKVLGVWSFENN